MKNIINFFITEKSQKLQKLVIIVIYALSIVLINIRMVHYQKSVNSYPDESSHVAYIAYLVKTNKIIPEFKEMQELKQPISEENNEFEENSVNHLGHPPLYYHFIKMFNLVKVNDTKITFDLSKLRLSSQIITSIALILSFYIGYKNLKTVLSNIIFAGLFISIPLISYISSAVQNDVLSFLGVSIYIIGMLRFINKKRNYSTYFIIAIATFICMLNKLTVGLVIGISYTIIMTYTMIKEKSFKCLFCRQWMVTIPIYLPIIFYYIILLNRYGTINPSLLNIAPEYLKTTMWYNDKVYKDIYTLKMYTPIWWINFKTYWAGINEKTHTLNKVGLKTIFPMIIFIFPALYYIIQKVKKEKINIVFYSIYISVLIAIAVQFFNAWHEFKYYTGYWGKFQGRYYICTMLPFVYAYSQIIEEIVNIAEKSKTKYLVIILTILIAIGYIFLLY